MVHPTIVVRHSAAGRSERVTGVSGIGVSNDVGPAKAFGVGLPGSDQKHDQGDHIRRQIAGKIATTCRPADETARPYGWSNQSRDGAPEPSKYPRKAR